MSEETANAILFGCAIAATLALAIIVGELEKIRRLLQQRRDRD